jgi:hypothetical protein
MEVLRYVHQNTGTNGVLEARLHDADTPSIAAVPTRYSFGRLITQPLISVLTSVPPHQIGTNLEVPVTCGHKVNSAVLSAELKSF